MSNVTRDQAREAKGTVKRLTASASDVVGIGLTKRNGGYVVQVNLSRASAHPELPPEVNGVPVLLEVVGEISAGG